MRRDIGTLGLLIVFEAGLLVFLHWLGSVSWMQIDLENPSGWLATTTPADVIAAVVRIITLVLASWLAGSTVLYLIASVSRIPVVIRSVGWMTLPAVRRLTDRVVAIALAASGLAGIAPLAVAALPSQDTVMPTVDTDGVLLPPGATIDETTTAIPVQTPVPDATVPLPPFPAQMSQIEAAGRRTSTQVTVEQGDNLWTISRHRLSEVGRRQPANEDIAPYWRLVVEHNRPHLISGDPDLIYAGEIIDLPPVEES